MRGRREQTVRELAMTGIKEMPSNAMWLLGKLLPNKSEDAPEGDEARQGRPEGTREGRRAGGSDRRRTPAAGSIDSLLRRADVAADRASSAESEALERAQEAKRLAEEVRRIVEDAEAELTETQIGAHKQMASQVLAAEAEGVEKIRRAEEEMAERVERIRSEGIEASEAELQRMRERFGREADEAREKARRAAESALQALVAADESVAQASELAAEAKRAAEAAAAEASNTAQRLEWGERAVVEEAASAFADEDGPVSGIVREGMTSTFSSSARPEGSDVPDPAGDLDMLTHVELLAMAVTAEVPDCRTMTREELIEALSPFTWSRGDA